MIFGSFNQEKENNEQVFCPETDKHIKFYDFYNNEFTRIILTIKLTNLEVLLKSRAATTE